MTNAPPLAHPDRKLLTRCPRCGLPADSGLPIHYVADDCIAPLKAQLAAVDAERTALQRRSTAQGATLALLRSGVRLLGRVATEGKDEA